jgi:hypothetical protein
MGLDSSGRPDYPPGPMMISRFGRSLASLGLVLGLLAESAHASPVMIAGDGTEKIHSTNISIIKQAGTSVVSIMPDYQGSLSPFALVLPIPSDVSVAQVTGLKREFLDRLDNITAPKFAEFWEMDPCDPGEVQQEWQRDLTAKASTGFLGTVDTGGSKKVAKELLMDMKSQEKKGEYTFSVVSGAELREHLSKKGLKLPSGGDENVASYESQGYKFLVADVETGRVELVGGNRAQLSPIRFVTATDYVSVPARFGLPSAAPAQELLIFSLVAGQRTQVKNYETKAAPTNLVVSFDIKERMGEYYAALHDRFLQKYPGTFLLEYAYPSWECGKPCPNEALLPHELLSLGGDAMDAKLPADVRRPKAPPATEEEKAAFKASLEGKTPKEKKELEKAWQAERDELVMRKALLARHRYIVTRLHYRYTAASLPKDPELGGGAAVRGGIDLPKGELGAADTAVAPADENAMQTRYNHMHPDISVLKCEKPERNRWGKAPRTYRGLNKIWVAEDLSRKKRDKIKLEDVVLTPVPDLGIQGKAVEAKKSTAPVAVAPMPEEKKGGCSVAALPVPSAGSGLAFALSALVMWLRRRRAVRS